MSYDEILDYPYHFEDACADSLREYFHALLDTLWTEVEGFSGKRPFGNSGWEYDIFGALVTMKVVRGSFDYDERTGEVYGLEDVDESAANALVYKLIEHVFKKGENGLE